MRKSQAFREMKTPHLKCRALAHPFDPKQTFQIRMDGRAVWEVHLVCLRCKVPATDYIFVSDGTRVKPRVYDRYPDGYLIEEVDQWGGRKEFNGNVRRELYSRMAKGGK